MSDDDTRSSAGEAADPRGLADITASTGMRSHPRRGANAILRAVIAGAAAALVFFAVANTVHRDLPLLYMVIATAFFWFGLTAENLPPTIDYGRAKPGESPADRGVWGALGSFAMLPGVTWPLASGAAWQAITVGLALALAIRVTRRFSAIVGIAALAGGSVLAIPVCVALDGMLAIFAP